MKSDAFRAAVESEDPEALTEALAEDVVFRSPVVFRAYEGREAVMQLLSSMMVAAMSRLSHLRHRQMR